ncbi:MAG: hypothetical protein NXH90_16960 [Flavobacteriaceae bacterium]|nr:hypothetical protein [Flavobacteriaceae bacterium]
MKKCIVTLTAAAFLYLACSPDEAIPYYHPIGTLALPTGGNTSLPPANSNNPYDYMGHKYLESLYGNTLGTTNGKTFKQREHPSNPYQALNHQIIESSLGQEARIILLGFLKSSYTVQDNGYSGFYSTIVDYESKILDHPKYKSVDKKTILSYTAMIRYASYPGDALPSTSEIEDEDWDLSTPNASRDTILDQEGKQDSESLAPNSDTKPPIQEP